MASFLSPSTHFVSTPKLTANKSHTLPSPPSSASFHRSRRIVSASYSATTERPTAISPAVSRPPESMYEILGIDMVASLQEIKSAYRRLARVSHPDVANSKDSSAEEFIKICEAYATLSDPEKRLEYDLSLFRRRMTSSANGTATSWRYCGYTTGRSWETDQCW